MRMAIGLHNSQFNSNRLAPLPLPAHRRFRSFHRASNPKICYIITVFNFLVILSCSLESDNTTSPCTKRLDPLTTVNHRTDS